MLHLLVSGPLYLMSVIENTELSMSKIHFMHATYAYNISFQVQFVRWPQPYSIYISHALKSAKGSLLNWKIGAANPPTLTFA